MWSLIKKSYLDARCALFIWISKGDIEFFKKLFKVVEQKWLMLQQKCELSKGQAWQQNVNESNLVEAN
jgi:hypothetical protein